MHGCLWKCRRTLRCGSGGIKNLRPKKRWSGCFNHEIAFPEHSFASEKSWTTSKTSEPTLRRFRLQCKLFNEPNESSGMNARNIKWNRRCRGIPEKTRDSDEWKRVSNPAGPRQPLQTYSTENGSRGIWIIDHVYPSLLLLNCFKSFMAAILSNEGFVLGFILREISQKRAENKFAVLVIVKPSCLPIEAANSLGKHWETVRTFSRTPSHHINQGWRNLRTCLGQSQSAVCRLSRDSRLLTT